MKIQFVETKYDLVDPISRSASHLGAAIVKADYSLDDIVADVKASSVVKVYDDADELIAQYEGYTIFVAASNYPIERGDAIIDVVSVELENADIQAQVNSLFSDVEDIEQIQSEHADDIANLNSAVDAITPYTVTETGYIGDTEVVFENIKDGELTVYVEDEEGNYPEYTVQRSNDTIVVSFTEPLEYITTVTISIL